MSLVFEAQAPILVGTSTGDMFPVRRIFCIGRNYGDHAREMGHDPDRDPPFYFTKWAEAVVPSGGTIAYPPNTHDYQFEAELVVAIGRGGRNIHPAQANDHIYGYAAGLDMTRRDLQAVAKSQGRPWDASKNFEQSAPLGLIHPAADVGFISAGKIQLLVNGAIKQSGDLSDMIWSVPDMLSHISHDYRLEAGDLIFTGTPAGVGPVKTGDTIVVHIDGLTEIVVTIGEPATD